MVKINKKINTPVCVADVPVGECFIHNNNLFMRIKTDRKYTNLNLETGIIWTGIHDDAKVLRVNVEISVLN